MANEQDYRSQFTGQEIDARLAKVPNLEAGQEALDGRLDTVEAAIPNKVDKVPGKGLSTEDYTTTEKNKLGALPTNSELNSALGGKQDVISDLSTIRSGAAAGATAYQKPSGGVPKTDLASGVQTSLDKADAAAPQSTTYTKTEVDNKIDPINAKIPSQASSSNQLADKDFVNSSISTATATHRGTYNLVTDLGLTTSATQEQIASAIATKLASLSIIPDNNDYVFVLIPTADATPTEIARVDRYKYNGTAWAFEYSINNSGFTAAQWASINSGITSALVTAFNAKYDKPSGGIPNSDLAGDIAKNKLASDVQASLGKADNAAPQSTTYTKTEVDTELAKKADKDTDATEGNLAKFDANGNPVGTNIPADNVAQKDGYYVTLIAGAAERLVGNNGGTESFFERTTGGDAEIANGTAQMLGVEGNSVKVNQLVASDASTVTVVSGHKYMSVISGVKTIATSTGVALSVTGGVDMVFDLTALGIDNLNTVAEVEAWLAEHWGESEYYDHNPGEVVNVNLTGIESTGRNLLDPTTGKAQIIGAYSDLYGNYYGITGTHGALTFVDAFGNESTITPDADGKFLLEVPGELTVATPGADCSVFLWWDGSKTDYSEHEVNVGRLDVTHIWGKKNGAGDPVRVWPTGMPGLGDLKDLLTIEGGAAVAKVYIGKRAYESGDESDSSVLTDGTNTYYVLETPEVYTDLVYMGSEYFADGTPVTLPVNYDADNWGIESVLPKNDSTIRTAKPTATFKYSVDVLEEQKTQQDEIDNLDEKKADKVGEFPGITAGAAKVLEGNTPQSAEFTFRKTGGNTVASGLAKMNVLKGKSLVFNQLVGDNDTAVTVPSGHRYISTINGTKSIGTSDGTPVEVTGGTDCVTDLTLMFGAGNEPVTVAEFEKLYPLAYYAYNAGQIVNNAATGLELVGFNQWDEEYKNGYYGASIGNTPAFSENAGYLSSKNVIPAFPETTYYIKGPSRTLRIIEVDANGKTIKMDYATSNTTYTTQAGCAGLLFSYWNTSTYNHNICISISYPSRNGQYEPYKRTVKPLNIPTLTGKKIVNGSTEGQESVVIFSDTVGLQTVVGMKGIGSVHDFGQVESDGYIRNVRKTIGVRAYESGDESDTSVITDMTNTIYVLATPEEYLLDTPILASYLEDGDGTERRLPEDTASAVLAPLAMDVTYPMDAVGQLNAMPKDYTSQATLDQLLSTLGTALNGTLAKTWDSTNNKWTFSFTPNA